MSKFTRNQLKDLVKECLVEILSEGLSADLRMVEHATNQSAPARRNNRPQPAPLPHRANSSALNSVVYGTGRPAAKAPERTVPTPPRQAVVESIGALTSDPIMSQIFADTASTTLQEQFSAESGRPGSPSGDELIGSPVDIFSESAKNWATLAFSDSPRKG